MLEAEYGTLFNREVHTYDRFRHAWMSIQARAFGRRLPWTALVPFADCLNHTNVQTKYDFNVNENGTFRLFPTGRNRYEKGKKFLIAMVDVTTTFSDGIRVRAL